MSVTFRGKPACPCLVAWLPVYEAELIRRRQIKHNLDIYQLTGNAKASAGTHTGGAYDVAQVSAVDILVAREMGAAAWHRTQAQGFDTEHQHGVLRGCPHNTGGRYQIAALEAGYNGLGHNGRGGRDNGPTPTAWRTWQQGIAWAGHEEYLARPALVAANVQRQFRRALHLEPGAVRAINGVRLVQEALNQEFPKRTALKVDGKVGPATLERWGQWEDRAGVVGRPRVADPKTLEALGAKTKHFRVR